jgi:hypothetical protein
MAIALWTGCASNSDTAMDATETQPTTSATGHLLTNVGA